MFSTRWCLKQSGSQISVLAFEYFTVAADRRRLIVYKNGAILLRHQHSHKFYGIPLLLKIDEYNFWLIKGTSFETYTLHYVYSKPKRANDKTGIDEFSTI
jgi:hypothetical protein